MTPYEKSLALHAAKLAAIPQGICKCGCGRSTPIARFTRLAYGIFKGQPVNYIHGHNKTRALKAHADQLHCICRNHSCTTPYGVCHCGCGGKTAISKQGHTKLGHIKGMPRKFIVGHSGVCRIDIRPTRYGEMDGVPVALLTLSRGLVAIIDLEDEWKVPGTWCQSNGYAIQWNRALGKCIRLHRVIMNAPDGLEVDHKNGNTLDNRKCNLRVVPTIYNRWNSAVRVDSASGEAGVTYRAEKKLWQARITVNGAHIFLGYFKTKEEAIAARRKAEIMYFGEYRRRRE